MDGQSKVTGLSVFALGNLKLATWEAALELADVLMKNIIWIEIQSHTCVGPIPRYVTQLTLHVKLVCFVIRLALEDNLLDDFHELAAFSTQTASGSHETLYVATLVIKLTHACKEGVLVLAGLTGDAVDKAGVFVEEVFVAHRILQLGFRPQ